MFDPKLLDLSEQELLVRIGESLTEGEFSAAPRKPEELAAVASGWIRRNLGRLADAVCARTDFHAASLKPEKELLFHGVCEVVVSVTTGVPAGLVAAYLVSRGLETLCHDRWQRREGTGASQE